MQSGHEFERSRTPDRRKADSVSIEGGRFEGVVGLVSTFVGIVSDMFGNTSGAGMNELRT